MPRLKLLDVGIKGFEDGRFWLNSSRRVLERFEASKRYRLLPLEICSILVKISWKIV